MTACIKNPQSSARTCAHLTCLPPSHLLTALLRNRVAVPPVNPPGGSALQTAAQGGRSQRALCLRLLLQLCFLHSELGHFFFSFELKLYHGWNQSQGYDFLPSLWKLLIWLQSRGPDSWTAEGSRLTPLLGHLPFPLATLSIKVAQALHRHLCFLPFRPLPYLKRHILGWHSREI